MPRRRTTGCSTPSSWRSSSCRRAPRATRRGGLAPGDRPRHDGLVDRTLLRPRGDGIRCGRRRRRSDARAALHDALAFLETSGAEPRAEQVRAELRAAGDPPKPSADPSLRSLTPQELQVALVVAGGATNKEAAASLFLSPKTVEFHLGNVYRELAIRSRTELVRRVASSS